MSQISYPTPVEHSQQGTAKASNHTRGMALENAINTANEYYRIHNKAIIYKKPTPIQVVKTSYPSRNLARITEAYYTIPSTTDYNGIYNGYYIDFEAKETHQKSFSFARIYPHQINHLKSIDEQGGIAFVIIDFMELNEIWCIAIKDFLIYYNESLNNEKAPKSINIKKVREIGYQVSISFAPPIDYLEAIDRAIKDNKFNIKAA